jgi:hypothetical protein
MLLFDAWASVRGTGLSVRALGLERPTASSISDIRPEESIGM